MTLANDTPSALVGEVLPKAMGPRDMMRAFGIGRDAFYDREREGAFKAFRLPRPIGTKRYSGERVQKFLSGRP